MTSVLGIHVKVSGFTVEVGTLYAEPHRVVAGIPVYAANYVANSRAYPIELSL